MLPKRKSIQFPPNYWPVDHRRFRVRNKYRNKWPSEVRGFWTHFLGLHTRWVDWEHYGKVGAMPH